MPSGAILGDMAEPASYVTGLDIGTSCVRCVVGLVEPEQGQLSVVGYGSAPTLGLRKGIVVHPDDVAEAILKAIAETERFSGVNIQSATVNINGSHISGLNSRGVVAISNANRQITADDRLRAEEAATIIKLPPNREIIQVFAKNYRLDGQDNLKDPVGMNGVRLEVDTHILTVSSASLRSLGQALEKAGFKANHFTTSAVAGLEAVLSRQQKESGTLLMDIGAGTTNLAVIDDGEVQYVAVLPVGGINLTNDLAIGLKTDIDVAENIKIKHTSLLDEDDSDVVTDGEAGHQQSYNRRQIRLIAEARMEEIFDLVERELRRIQKNRKLPGGVVMVGGASKLPGLDRLAREKLQLPARIGQLQPLSGLSDAVADPVYAAAVGLMELDLLLTATNGPPPKLGRQWLGEWWRRWRR